MFGNKPFGANTSNSFTNSFGAAPAFGQSSTFGAGTATTSNTFGTQPNMLFGGGVAGAQQPSTSLFSSNVGTNVGFGKPAAFGAATPQHSAFQSPGTSLFSSNTGANTGGLFAQNTANQTPSTSFGQPAAVNASPFGQSAANTSVGLFGSGTNTFASSPFQRAVAQTTGTVSVKFKPVTGTENAMRNNQSITVNTRNNCICSMKEYENKSLEELRLEDYSMNVTGPQQQQQQQQNAGMLGTGQVMGGLGSGTAAQTAGMGLFRSNTGSVFDNKSPFSASTTGFGLNASNTSTQHSAFSAPGNSLFSNQQKPLFSSLTTNKPFSMTPFSTSAMGTGATTTLASSFGMSGFNSSTTAASTSLFSTPQQQQQQQQTNAFAQPNKPLGSFFQTSTSAPAQQPSLLGSGSTALQPQQTTTGGLFSFDNSANAAGAQQTNFLGGTTSLFGGSGTGNTLAQSKPSLFQSSTALPSAASTIAPGTGSSFLPAFSSNTTSSLTPFNSTSATGSLFSNQPTSSLFGGVGGLGSGPSGTSTLQQAQQQQQPMFGAGLSSGGFLGSGLAGTAGAASFGGGLGGVAGLSGLSSAFQSTNPQTDTNRDLFLIKMKFGPFGTQGNSLNQKPEPKITRTELMLTKALSERQQRLKTELNRSNIRLSDYKRKMFFSLATPHESDIELQFDYDDSVFPRTSAEKYPKKYIHLKSDTENIDIETSLKRLVQTDENDESVVSSSDKLNEPDLELEQQPQHGKKPETPTTKSTTASVSSSSMPASSSSRTRTNADSLVGNIIMNRSDYYTIPPLAEIRQSYQAHNDTCFVSNLTVGRYGYGSIHFPGTLDVANLNFDKIIEIDVKKALVYPRSEDKPPAGKGLNRMAYVTIERFWPLDKLTKEPLTSQTKAHNVDHVQYLMDLCKSMDANFIEYNYDTGSFVYQKMSF